MPLLTYLYIKPKQIKKKLNETNSTHKKKKEQAKEKVLKQLRFSLPSDLEE